MNVEIKRKSFWFKSKKEEYPQKNEVPPLESL